MRVGRRVCGTADANPKVATAREARVPFSAVSVLPGSTFGVRVYGAAGRKASIFREGRVSEASEGSEETKSGKTTPKTPSPTRGAAV